jgi:hypothetical protein
VNKKYRKDHDEYPLPPLPGRPKENSKRVRKIVTNTASSSSGSCIYERGYFGW